MKFSEALQGCRDCDNKSAFESAEADLNALFAFILYRKTTAEAVNSKTRCLPEDRLTVENHPVSGRAPVSRGFESLCK